MAIGFAQQTHPTSVHIFDDKGQRILQLNGTLIGYTSTTVTVRPSHSSTIIYLYDEQGHIVRQFPG